MNKKTMLVVGAAGFIGRAACEYYRGKFDIIGVDDLSRPTAKPPEGVKFYLGDAVTCGAGFIESADVVLHLAAQVSVVRSEEYPVDDFRRNAEVTMKLANCARFAQSKPIFIYASTNKVYGDLEGVSSPILDTRPLSPATPYGISKATGGLYVREFLPDRGYDFRQSCIMGETQARHATEDQGWVGYLIRQIENNQPITCYGDGTQVRDLLHVTDLLRAYDLAIENKIPAGSYNVGGGVMNSLRFGSVVELLGGEIARYADWRPHDQRRCVMASDGLRRAGWQPRISALDWLTERNPAYRAVPA